MNKINKKQQQNKQNIYNDNEMRIIKNFYEDRQWLFKSS